MKAFLRFAVIFSVIFVVLNVIAYLVLNARFMTTSVFSGLLLVLWFIGILPVLAILGKWRYKLDLKRMKKRLKGKERWEE